MNHASIYCKTLESVTKEELINALHQSLMQLSAADKGVESLNHKPTIAESARIMAKAGHIGFPSQPATKPFRVLSVSANPNSFGLHGHILIAQDGDAYEVGRAIGAWLTPWPKGTDVKVPIDPNGVLTWAGLGVEIPRQLPPAPAAVLSKVFPKVKQAAQPI